MSDKAKGAARVRAVEQRFHRLGFRTVIAAGSGQRKGAMGESLRLDGDLLAIAPEESGWPHFVCEVGGKSKSVRLTLLEMTAQGPLPAGFLPLVARHVGVTGRARGEAYRWHLDSDDAFDSLPALLAAVRER